jgi:hypothetical protein
VSSSIDSTKGLLDIVYEPENLDYVSPHSMYYSDAPLHQSELEQLRHSDGRFPWPCPGAFSEVSKYFDDAMKQADYLVAVLGFNPANVGDAENVLRLKLDEPVPLLQRPLRERITAKLERIRDSGVELQECIVVGRILDTLKLSSDHPTEKIVVDVADGLRRAPAALQALVLEQFDPQYDNVAEWEAMCRAQFETEIALLRRIDGLNVYENHVALGIAKNPVWLICGKLKDDIERAGGRFRQALLDRLASKIKSVTDDDLAVREAIQDALAIVQPSASAEERIRFAQSWIKTAVDDCHAIAAKRNPSMHLTQEAGEHWEAEQLARFDDACRVLVRSIQALKLPKDSESEWLSKLSDELLQIAKDHPTRIPWVRDGYRYLPSELSADARAALDEIERNANKAA